jgi:hypothetical protein
MKMTKAEVVELRFRSRRGEEFVKMYGVKLFLLPGHDEMWEPMTHAAVFITPQEAQRLADRVNAARGNRPINFDCWIHEESDCSPIGAPNKAYFYSPIPK